MNGNVTYSQDNLALRLSAGDVRNRPSSFKNSNSTVRSVYDRAGKFQGVAYNDGKRITVTYDAHGSVSGLTSNRGTPLFGE